MGLMHSYQNKEKYFLFNINVGFCLDFLSIAASINLRKVMLQVSRFNVTHINGQKRSHIIKLKQKSFFKMVSYTPAYDFFFKFDLDKT